MQQNGAFSSAALAVFALLPVLFMLDCSAPSCRDLQGRWTNREGQAFYFQGNGKALWLVRFGSQMDTFVMDYRYDCRKQPAELDLSGFKMGPLSGKTMYGILEWSNDSTFRFDSETGTRPDVRPADFKTEQTQKFFREK